MFSSCTSAHNELFSVRSDPLEQEPIYEMPPHKYSAERIL